jgi:RimJ/RimL family protein N-acetyltransferase
MTEFPVITDGSIRVLPFGEEHLTERYVGWLNDPEVVRYSEQRHGQHSLESSRQYFEAQKKSENWFLAIESLEDVPVHIGNLGVLVNRANKLADVSIMVGDKDYWGTGAGNRAWQLVLDTLLDELGFRMVIARTLVVNKPMIRVMERSGMTIDSSLPRRFFWEGRKVDVICASKTSSVNTQKDQTRKSK